MYLHLILYTLKVNVNLLSNHSTGTTLEGHKNFKVKQLNLICTNLGKVKFCGVPCKCYGYLELRYNQMNQLMNIVIPLQR